MGLKGVAGIQANHSWQSYCCLERLYWYLAFSIGMGWVNNDLKENTMDMPEQLNVSRAHVGILWNHQQAAIAVE